jgi:hypothetical protein
VSDRRLRHFCRNARCRSKLASPTDNHHKAFCSQYCYDQFYRWKCVVCEKELPRKGKPRTLCRGHKCGLDYRNFRPAYLLSDSSGLPPGPKCKSDSKSPCKTGTFLRIGEGPGWRWEANADEHRLFLRDDHVVTISAGAGDWRVTYPHTIPIQSAPSLEDARKLALHVALWTFGLNGRKARPKSKAPPINLIGGYRFPGAPRLDEALRREVLAPAEGEP